MLLAKKEKKTTVKQPFFGIKHKLFLILTKSILLFLCKSNSLLKHFKHSPQNAMLTHPVFTTKQAVVFPSFHLTPAEARASVPLGPVETTDKCVYRHLCASSGRKEKKNIMGVGGGGCFAQHFLTFIAHSPHKGLSVLLASYSGRRPHDSPVPISRVKL